MENNIFELKEWIKWLSYKSKPEEKIILELFIKYINKKCNKVEYMKVYNYLNNYSLEKIIDNKLDKYDLAIIKQRILKLNNKSETEIYNYIKKQQSNYEDLSIIDAYILHVMLKKYHQNEISESKKFKIDIKD